MQTRRPTILRLLNFTCLAPALAGLLLASATALAGPDTSSSTRIPQPGGYAPQAVTTDLYWAAMGRGQPSSFSGNLAAHPVTMTGPWTGGPFLDLEIDPPALGANTVEEFGSALSLQGNRIAIGAPAERQWVRQCGTGCMCCFVADQWVSGGGKVRLYLFDGPAASFLPERTIAFGDLDDRFGAAVALRRLHMLVGSPGAVPGRADLFDPDTGAHITSFYSPDTAGTDGYATTVALSRNLALVGAPGANTVYVYRHDGAGNWSDAGTLSSPGTGSEFGAAIAIDGNRIVAGAPGIARAFIFEDTGGPGWPVVAELAGTATSNFGRSVGVTGDTVWVAAPTEPAGASTQGRIARFDRDTAGLWPQTGTLAAKQAVTNDNFGHLISVSSRQLAALSSGEKAMYVFTDPAFIHDPDGDGSASLADNCPNDANAGQEDFDGDAAGDACDLDDDGDGLSDADEAAIGSDPLNPDTDGDGLSDAQEVAIGSDPLNPDTDGDGLSDAQEVAIGSDPLDTDTDDDGIDDGEDPLPTIVGVGVDGDGDGIRDEVDNCPQNANAGQENFDGDSAGDACDADGDNDGVSNTVEIANGTNPFDKDTDDDGHSDLNDRLPLDPLDGWSDIERLPFAGNTNNYNSHMPAIGDGVVLATDSTRILHAFTRQAGGWAPVAAPLVNGLPVPTPAYPSMRGKRAAVINTGSDFTAGADDIVYLFEWSKSAGWTLLNTVDVFAGSGATYYSSVLSVAIDKDLVAMHVELGLVDQIWIYQRSAQGISRVATRDVSWGGTLVVAGDTVFYGDWTVSSQDGQISIYEAGNGFTGQTATVANATTRDAIGKVLNVVRDREVLVDSNIGSFWLKKNGSWTLTPTGIGSGPGDAYSGEGGKILIHGTVNDYDVTVQRTDGGAVLGVVQRFGSGAYSRVATNGRVIVQNTPQWIEFYPIDLDADAVPDDIDNCPDKNNPDQLDSDGDGIGNVCDPPNGC